MVAVRASLARIQEAASGKLYTIACVNGPSDTVLSGTQDEMNDVIAVLEKATCRCIKLDVAYAFHSEQLDSVLEDFEAACKTGVVFQEPKLPFISSLLGKVIFDAKTLNANYMRRASRETVDFVTAMETAQRISTVNEETVWIEMGPHPVCCGFIKAIMTNNHQLIAVPSIRRGVDNWTTLGKFQRPFETRLRLLDLPTYAWQEKNYWLQYNGDWCLTKGNTFYNAQKEEELLARLGPSAAPAPRSEISTSTVQQILELNINGAAGSVVMQSDLMQRDLLAAAHGHRMNGCGVVTSSIHADLAYTLGNYFYKKFFPKAKDVKLNVANLVVTKGLVAQNDTKTPQQFRVTASIANINTGVIDLVWQNVDNDGNVHEPFATANVLVESASDWYSNRDSVAHLVHGRIEALEALANSGKASRFTHSMAYTLFASNLVDYAEKYRGMQSVIMNELEGFANVELTTTESGDWTVPPYFIDSDAHLAGFIMNCSDAIDTQKNYCVTPGWKSMRFAEPLVAGNKYTLYVKMIPIRDDPTGFLRDVYIMRQEDSQIVGMVGGIKFHRRILLNKFFSAPDKTPTKENKPATAKSLSAPALAAAAAFAPVVAPAPQPETIRIQTPPNPDLFLNMPTAQPGPPKAPVPAPVAAPAPTPAPIVVQAPAASENSIVAKALALIANEAALEPEDLTDDASFANLGVDSLMSLVISEKFRSDLDINIGGSMFLDYPTIGDLKAGLEKFYG